MKNGNVDWKIEWQKVEYKSFIEINVLILLRYFVFIITKGNEGNWNKSNLYASSIYNFNLEESKSDRVLCVRISGYVVHQITENISGIRSLPECSEWYSDCNSVTRYRIHPSSSLPVWSSILSRHADHQLPTLDYRCAPPHPATENVNISVYILILEPTFLSSVEILT